MTPAALPSLQRTEQKTSQTGRNFHGQIQEQDHNYELDRLDLVLHER